MLSHQEVRRRFIEFFVKRGHQHVPSSSLLPTDPSVLFTTAGMQQFKPYYTGEVSPCGDKAVSIQKCIRTSDIDEVGDNSHLTFFEMLGNFAFNNSYWKKEAIEYAHDIISKELGLKIDYVSIFEGDASISADTESEEIWKSIDPNIEIKKFGKKDNFWGPTGDEGPCGPTTEIYVNGVEIWNVVFNQYYKDKSGNLKELEVKGIDTGAGLERIMMAVQNSSSIFETDLFVPIIEFLPKELPEKIRRIMADHSRAISFILSDGVRPSNKEQGYVLRRLMRRIFAYYHIYKLSPDTLEELIKIFIQNYQQIYPELANKCNDIINAMWQEHEKFNKTVVRGINELEKIEIVDATSAFTLYESYGLPYEIIKELGENRANSLTRENFDQEFKKHQEKSRAGAEKKFGGHGLILDTGELKAANEEELQKVTRLHTATHLLQASLRKILGNEVTQAGSDITAERLRFDFTFSSRLESNEIQKVEDLVNEVIGKDLNVVKKSMPYQEALKTDALHFSKIKYPDMVDVYSVEGGGETFSKEFCGGPHVTHTGEIGKFKIIKEEGISAGVRRIRAIVE